MFLLAELRQHHNGECLVPNDDNSEGESVSVTPDEESGNENEDNGNDENLSKGTVSPESAEVEQIS